MSILVYMTVAFIWLVFAALSLWGLESHHPK
jgi:hypothetical protein